jgi:hypothetical protein
VATTTRKKSSITPPEVGQRPTPLVDLGKDAFDPAKVTRLLLFEVDGVDYYIPDGAQAMVLQETARLERETGQGAAMWFLFGELLDEEALKALREYKGLTRAHLTQLYAECVKVITGPKA